MKPLFDESTKVLFRVRFFRPIDFYLMAAVIVLILLAVLFGPSHRETAFALILGSLVMLDVWLIALVFRACYFILQARADVHNMTSEAAKLVHAYQLGPTRQP